MTPSENKFGLSALIWSLTSKVRLYGAIVFVTLSLINSALYLKSSHNAACAVLENKFSSLMGPLGRELLLGDVKTANAVFLDFKETLRKLDASESLKLEHSNTRANDGGIQSSAPKCHAHFFHASVQFPITFGNRVLGQVAGTVSYFSLAKLLLMVGIIFLIISVGIRMLSRRLDTELKMSLVSPMKRISQGETLTDRVGIPSEVLDIEEDIRLLKADIKEKERQNFELLKTKQLGEQAEDLSHNIISPLNAINSVVLELENIDETQKKTLGLAVARIEKITRDLLKHNTSRIEDKTFSAMDAVIHELITEKMAEYRNRTGIHFNIQIEPSGVSGKVNANPEELKTVLSNLINNSVEALAAGGTVTIRSISDASNAIVTVEDNGKGIPANLIPLLMQRGKSYDKPSGSGLGLYYAKQSVESWNGSIKVESAFGFGTKVHLVIPRSEVATKQEPTKQKTGANSNWNCILIDNDELTRLVWEAAAVKDGIRLKCFGGAEEFFGVSDSLDRSVSIYIDSDLGNGKRGEVIAKDIAGLGFKNISLATGFQQDHFPRLPWITQILSKRPPWRIKEIYAAS